MEKHAEDVLPWEDINELSPEDPELHALALSLQDKTLHDKVDAFMSERAEIDGREHDRTIARSWELARNIVIYR